MFLSSMKLYMGFRDLSFPEEVNGVFMEPVISPGSRGRAVITQNGYVMTTGQYLEQEFSSSGRGFDLNMGNSFIISFLLTPSNIGSALNTVTGVSEDIKMSLLDFVDFASIENKIISIYELSSINGENKLVVSLNEGEYTVTSEGYSASIGSSHVFWIAYNGFRTLDIYIDGRLDEGAVKIGTLPPSFSIPLLELFVNRNFEPYSYNNTNNIGAIADLIFLDTDAGHENLLKTYINKSFFQVIDDFYTSLGQFDTAALFDDPSSIRVNSCVDDNSFVLLGRNDGKILKGSQLFWQVRRNYANKNEGKVLNESVIVSGNESVVENGVLQVKNSIIRL